jgi:peptidyl-tRNA hydrolase
VLHDFATDEEARLDQLISHVAKACKALANDELNVVKSLYSLKSIESLEA